MGQSSNHGSVMDVLENSPNLRQQRSQRLAGGRRFAILATAAAMLVSLVAQWPSDAGGNGSLAMYMY